MLVWCGEPPAPFFWRVTCEQLVASAPSGCVPLRMHITCYTCSVRQGKWTHFSFAECQAVCMQMWGLKMWFDFDAQPRHLAWRMCVVAQICRVYGQFFDPSQLRCTPSNGIRLMLCI